MMHRSLVLPLLALACATSALAQAPRASQALAAPLHHGFDPGRLERIDRCTWWIPPRGS
jgi:hypothetical protein